MSVADRVKTGTYVLLRLQPKWFDPVNKRSLTFRNTGEHHLLSQIFGSFEEGAKRVTEHSGLTLVEMGFMPLSAEDDPHFKDETLFLLRQWVMTVSVYKPQRTTA